MKQMGFGGWEISLSAWGLEVSTLLGWFLVFTCMGSIKNVGGNAGGLLRDGSGEGKRGGRGDGRSGSQPGSLAACSNPTFPAVTLTSAQSQASGR